MPSYDILFGAAVTGAGFLGYKLFSKKQQFSCEAKKLKQKEETQAKKATDKLLTTSFYLELADLKKQLEGYLVLPSDGEEYHQCRRRAFNQDQRGFPLVIARVYTAKDVSECIKFANKYRKEINICITCGGHSGKCMMDGAFVIDMKHMNEAELGDNKISISVEGGAYLEEIDKILQPHNLGVTIGTYPQTGVGGLVLGGGYGYLARMYGFSADNLIECEVVLQNGDIVIANDHNEHSDLMWGLRGGGGNFGVVTKFVLKVHQLPSYCISGIVAKLTPTLVSAVGAIENFDKMFYSAPDNISAFAAFPGGSIVSPIGWAYFGEEKIPSKVPIFQKAVKEGGWATLKNSLTENSYHNDLQSLTTATITNSYIYHTLIQFGELEKPMPHEFWESLLTFTRKKLHPSLVKSLVMILTMGGKIATTDPDGTKACFAPSIRKARYFCIIEAYWKPEYGEDGRNEARNWCKSAVELISPYSNEALRYASPDSSESTDLLSVDGGMDQPGYSVDIYPKLQALKNKYDPTNLFKNNVNISSDV